jgi:hypothetical protein
MEYRGKADAYTIEMIAEDHGLKALVSQARTLRDGREYVRFTLKPGQLSPKNKDETSRYQRRGYMGERIHAVCWHGHRDFMRALFDFDSEARLTTAMADYRSREGFNELYPATAWRNIGSQINPLDYANACDCGADA